ncbi:outer membrane beta-barrel protein [Spirosoma pollinicola]|uniref:Uncharacterized protein n=1 Tax=Spirosoma pollinicola TaxID=2057025 RepID=A0A2K8YU60_9BACT|nr:outer membrane beta-barrel protein [Spirosoma pollinicola]AUD01129.1 hypothetical protein CWM47_04425 [Spirosoma pollinicola]
MKTLTCLLLIASVNTAFGQHKFALSIQLAPICTHTNLKAIFPFADPATQSPNTEFSAVSNGLSYLVGVTARYAFSPKLSVGTGIWATHSATGKTNYVQNGFASSIRYKYNHPFTNLYKIPLIINYQSSTKRLSPYFSAGATFDLRGTSYVDLSGNGELIPIKVGKAVVITPLLGVGMTYNLSDHISLIVQPTIQYNIDSHPSYSYYHYYQLSLQNQLMYKF